ncbi:hypothetical protein [Coleofasciculus sp. G2-EDA-02]|uniref:hypothetical protein n=1 Tax=Coleofasciculus sp. G2-EDA-02 TaxID=3069529 RepID=UPI0032FE492F
MNTNPKNNDSLSLNFNVGGNSPPANLRYNGSPLAAFKMDDVGTPLPGLYCCGDSTFPGIGLPAVAASGMIAANTLAPVQKHLDMLRDIGCIR